MTKVPPTPEYVNKGSVLRWVDGDTVDLRVDLGYRTWVETRFRLYGIDTPERGQKNHDEATAHNVAIAPAGSAVVLQSYKDPDKYGRWLAEIWVGDVDLNQSLVSLGLAVAYFGGTKQAAA